MTFEATTSSDLAKIAKELAAQLAALTKSHQEFAKQHPGDPTTVALGSHTIAINNVGIAVVKTINTLADYFIAEARLRRADESGL